VVTFHLDPSKCLFMYTHKVSSHSSSHEKDNFSIHFILHVIHKGSLILQRTELNNKPKSATASLATEREGNSNTGKKITSSQMKRQAQG